MAKAVIKRQIAVKTENKVGMLAEVTSAISASGANIQAICAYGEGNEAFFWMITSDNAQAIAALKQKGLSAQECDVVAVMLPDKVGEGKAMADKIKAAGINLDYIYGSTCGCADQEAMIVIGSKEDTNKLIAAING